MTNYKIIKSLQICLTILIFCTLWSGCSTKNIGSIENSQSTSASTDSTTERTYGQAASTYDNDITQNSHKFNGNQSESVNSEIPDQKNNILTQESSIETTNGNTVKDESNNTQSESQLNNQPSIEPAQEYPDQSEPSNSTINQNTCKFLIDCSKALEYDKLPDSIRTVLPSDGIIYSENVEFTPGESVFDVLSRILKDNDIPMESSFTPAFGSRYIEGINSLYEFDCGETSGWVYFVNGSMPNYGCDRHQIKNDDDIRWYYTCNMGYDISL